MDANATRFFDNADRFTRTVGDADLNWAAQSPCSDWTVAEVLDHVIDTQRAFAAQHGQALGERPSGSPAQMWAEHWSAMASVANDASLMATTYDGWFGPTTIGETLHTFYGFDLLVHAWDIGASSGAPPVWTEAELAQAESAIASFGPALYMEGICAPAIEVADDAAPQVRLLGLLGRRA